MATAKTNFFMNGKFFKKGDEVKATFEQIVRLNEKGLIEPLTTEELEKEKEE